MISGQEILNRYSTSENNLANTTHFEDMVFDSFEPGKTPGRFTFVAGYSKGKFHRLRSRGVEQNIGLYELNSAGDGENADLLFHIERIVSYDVDTKKVKFAYRTMIDGYHALGSKEGPTKSAFAKRAGLIKGLVKGQDATFTDPKTGIFVNWDAFEGEVQVGAISPTDRSTLKECIEKDVPRVVSLFNRIYPEKKIPGDIVKRVIEMARISDKIIPQLIE